MPDGWLVEHYERGRWKAHGVPKHLVASEAILPCAVVRRRGKHGYLECAGGVGMWEERKAAEQQDWEPSFAELRAGRCPQIRFGLGE